MTGILALAISELYSLCATLNAKDAIVQLSCFEIYNSQVRCLLGGGTGDSNRCAVREDEGRAGRARLSGSLGTVQVIGLNEVRLFFLHDILTHQICVFSLAVSRMVMTLSFVMNGLRLDVRIQSKLIV